MATDGDDIAISVCNVGKMYYLYDRPQDRLKQAFLWGRRKLYREFWALRDVSFEVRRGEALGIIGRNRPRRERTVIRPRVYLSRGKGSGLLRLTY